MRWAPDARGAWRPTPSTTAAIVWRGDVRVPLTPGLVVEPGDRVVTEEARVRVGLPGGETLVVAPHSDVEVRPRSTLQRLGEVYYSVRDVFTVQYGTVQTSVDGTEFTVRGDDGVVAVTVVQGRVRVATAGSEARVRAGQIATAGPPLRVATPVGAGLAAVRRTYAAGAPRVEVGGFLSGGVAAGGATRGVPVPDAGARVTVLGRLGDDWRIAVDLGLTANGGSGLRVPLALGPEWGAGAFTTAIQGVAALEVDRLGCSGAYTALHLGGMGSVRYTHALARQLFVAGVVRVGWVESPVADASVGLLVPL